MKRKISLFLSVIFLFSLLVVNGAALPVIPVTKPNLPVPIIALPTPTPQIPPGPVNPVVQPPLSGTSAQDIIDISAPIPSVFPFIKLENAFEKVDPGKLPLLQQKDVEILFPEEGDIIKDEQMYIVELTVNKTGSYEIHVNNSKVDTGFSFTAGSTIVWPVYNIYNKETPVEMKIIRKSDNSVAAKVNYTIEAAKFDFKAKAIPGNNSVKLDWEAPASLPGRIEYLIYRQKSGEKWMLATDFAIAENTYTDKNVKNGSYYTYSIAASVVGGPNTVILGYKNVDCVPYGIMVLTVGNPNMTVNGEIKEIDPGKGTSPVIVNGRTFVPVRAIIEAMGGTVSWDGAAKKVTINCNTRIIELVIGSNTAAVNGTSVETDAAPYISDTGRTMLPLRFIIDNLGYDVTWENITKTITIKYTSY